MHAAPSAHSAFTARQTAKKAITHATIRAPKTMLPKITSARMGHEMRKINAVTRHNLKKANDIVHNNLHKKTEAIKEAVQSGAMSPQQAAHASQVAHQEAQQEAQQMHHAVAEHHNSMVKATQKDTAQKAKDDYQKVIVAVNHQAEEKANDIDRKIRQVNFMAAQGKLSEAAADGMRKQLMGQKQKLELDRKKRELELKKAFLTDMAKNGIISSRHDGFHYVHRKEAALKKEAQKIPKIANIKSDLFGIEHWIRSYQSAIRSAEQMGANYVTIPINTRREGVKEFRMTLAQAKQRYYTLLAKRNAEVKKLEKMSGRPLPRVVVLDKKTREPVPATHVKAAYSDALAKRDMKLAQMLRYAILTRPNQAPRGTRVIKIYIDMKPYLVRGAMAGERVVSTSGGKARTPRKGFVPNDMAPAIPHAVVKSVTPPTDEFIKADDKPNTTGMLTGQKPKPKVAVAPAPVKKEGGVISRFLNELRKVI